MFAKDHQILGKRIRDLRKEAGLSLRAFGKMVGMNKDYLVDIEKGRKSPTLDSLCKISYGLETTLSDLLEGIGPRPNGNGNKPPQTFYHGTKL